MKPAHLTGMVVGLSNRRSERGVLTAFTRAGLRLKSMAKKTGLIGKNGLSVRGGSMSRGSDWFHSWVFFLAFHRYLRCNLEVSKRELISLLPPRLEGFTHFITPESQQSLLYLFLCSWELTTDRHQRLQVHKGTAELCKSRFHPLVIMGQCHSLHWEQLISSQERARR